MTPSERIIRRHAVTRRLEEARGQVAALTAVIESDSRAEASVRELRDALSEHASEASRAMVASTEREMRAGGGTLMPGGLLVLVEGAHRRTSGLDTAWAAAQDASEAFTAAENERQAIHGRRRALGRALAHWSGVVAGAEAELAALTAEEAATAPASEPSIRERLAGLGAKLYHDKMMTAE